MDAARGGIRAQRLANLAGLALLEPQTWMDVGIRQCRLSAGQNPQPLANTQRLFEAFADTGQIDVTLGVHASPFSPEPRRSCGAQHIERCLTDLALTTGVEQVVNGAEFRGGNAEPQHRRALAVGPGLGFVVNNLRLRGHKLPEFGHLVLQESRLRCARGQCQLDVTTARTAIWDKTAICQQQTEQPPDVCSVQLFLTTQHLYSKP